MLALSCPPLLFHQHVYLLFLPLAQFDAWIQLILTEQVPSFLTETGFAGHFSCHFLRKSLGGLRLCPGLALFFIQAQSAESFFKDLSFISIIYLCLPLLGAPLPIGFESCC